MKYLLLICILIRILVTPAYALELEAPRAPESAEKYMPDTQGEFANDLMELVTNVLQQLIPDIKEAMNVSVGVIGIVILLCVVQSFHTSVKMTAEYAGTLAVSSFLFLSANTMIQLGVDTISKMSEYGKLLFPVMTTAMAAQGGVSSSAAIYTGVTAFSTITCSLISKIFLPMVYVFLGLSTANSAIGEDLLKNLCDLLKQLIHWSLKTLLTVFTTYIGITGAVSGTTDAATLKAAKITIASFVPVVGGILSDASEAVLVSVGFVKNAAGIYGILAILAIFLRPFLRIGIHYIFLKVVSGICDIFGSKRICKLIGDFSAGMGLILAMTGTICILLLIGSICFIRGVR